MHQTEPRHELVFVDVHLEKKRGPVMERKQLYFPEEKENNDANLLIEKDKVHLDKDVGELQHWPDN